MLDESTARALSTIIIALGGPALIFSLGRTLWKWWTGRAGRERIRNNDLLARAEDADTKRRKTQEYASRLRRQLFEAGLEPEEWPDEVTVPRKPKSRPTQKE